MYSYSRLAILVLACLAFSAGASAETVSDTGGPIPADAVTWIPTVANTAELSTQGIPDNTVPMTFDSAAAGATRTEFIQASTVLRGLTAEERVNGSIDLEFGVSATAHQRTLRGRALELWRLGQHERAIGVVEVLEGDGAFPVVGIEWTEPVPSAASPKSGKGIDVRIGTSTGAEKAILDFDRPTQNLFALVMWGNTWTLNISTNLGASWSETYNWGAAAKCGMVVVDDFVYVAYVPDFALGEWRVRRFFASTGLPDTAFGNTTNSVSPQNIYWISVAGNQDQYDNRVYVAIIQDNQAIRFFWDESSDGTTFTERSPSYTDGFSGLDLTWNAHQTADRAYAISYRGSDDQIYVLVRSDAGWDRYSVFSGYDGVLNLTSISAYRDTLITAFRDFVSPDYYIYYRISYTGGSTWSSATFGAAGDNFGGVQVSARSGAGTAMFHWSNEAATDIALWRFREGYGPGAWDYEQQLNDGAIYPWYPVELEWMAPIHSHGVVFIGEPPDQIPYFDSDDWYTPILFIDGFEAGDASYWDSLS